MEKIISNNKISAPIFCKFAIAVNLIAFIFYSQINFNPTDIQDINGLKSLFLVSVGAQSVLVATIVRLLFYFNNNYEATQGLNFIELIKQNKIQKSFLLYITSAVILITYTGYLIKINLFLLILLSLIILIANIYFFYFINKHYKGVQSSNIMAINSIIFIFSSSTITLFGISKLILLYYPLGGLIFSFLLK